ncbi:asparagine synthase (glutamine-hydrolyzing) [bacterium]|nr:asparagine synthase (glutamine-hydrolyzing) [bacterium]
MSAIYGFLKGGNSNSTMDGLVERMAKSLAHRGPDGEAAYIKENIGLGMQILNIFTKTEIQYPLTNEDGSIKLFIDGEIYNYQELRKNLETKGHVFQTKADTEVIVHLYEDLGVECVHQLRGIFAFALWDARKGKLFIFRDHVGVKPVYYTVVGDVLLFGTEIKALLQYEYVKKELNYDAFDHYLNFRFIPEPETIYRSIHKLKAGCYLTFERSEAKETEYWDYEFPTDVIKRDDEWIEGLLEHLRDAIKIRMIGQDFPFGSYLSGGMDSSSIVKLLSEMLDYPLPTFSIAFDEKDYDESFYQHIVAKHCGTDHHEFVVRPESVESILPKLVNYFDQPFGDSSALPSYYLAKQVRQHVPVVYTGDGGDELLAGYTTYAGMHHSERYRKLPGLISKHMIPGILAAGEAILPQRLTYDIQRMRKIVNDALLPMEARYFEKIAIARKAERYRLYNDNTLQSISKDNESRFYHFFEKMKNKPLLHKVNYIDAKLRFANSVLMKTEQTCAANSLSIRPPMLDHKLIEFGSSVPPRLKLKGFQTKYLLHRAMADKLPKEVHEKRKHGFEPPLTVWFKDGLKPYIQEMLLSPQSRVLNYVNRKEMENIINTHVSGKRNLGEHIWGLLFFEEWHRQYLD